MEKKQTKPVVKEKKVTIDITKKEPIDKVKKIAKENSTVVMGKVAESSKEQGSKNVKAAKKEKIERTRELMKKYNVTSVVMISLVLFICSFIIAAQLNTVGNTDIVTQGMREAELLTELQKANNKYEELKEEYEKSQIIVDEYRADESSNDLLISSMTTLLERAEILAGLVKVKGQGVVITLADSMDTNIPVEAGLVHDTDLMAIVNELRAAGAEAISVNGQRIISTTAIRCVGPTIQINEVKVASPFHIKAIGDAKYLESALNIKNGIVDNFKVYGINVEVKTDNNITIDKYDNTLTLKYASEVK